MPECPTQEKLAAFVEHACPDEENRRLRAHIEICPACAAWLRKVASNERMVNGFEHSPETLQVSEGAHAVPPKWKRPPPIFEADEVVRELHRGGQGIVYEVIQKSTKRKVAVKVLGTDAHPSRAAKKRFEREIELVAQLNHPNIIEVYSSGETRDGQQYYVMEYVRGLPLDRYVRDHDLSLEDTLTLFSKVCQGVQYAHHKGVIHRDLKPSNILVDANGNPKVLDFGLAKLLSQPIETIVSVTRDLVGTVPYMSPEQIRGNPDEIDARTDVYALGILLYELLTGNFPYPVVGQMVDVMKHITRTPPMPPIRNWTRASGVTRRSSRHWRGGRCPIDHELETIVLKTLAKEPQRRYQSAGELAGDIDRYLSGDPISARRDSIWYLMSKTLRRHKAPASAAALFLLVGMCLGAFAAFQSAASERARERAQRKLESKRDSSIALASEHMIQARELYETVLQAIKEGQEAGEQDLDRLSAEESRERIREHRLRAEQLFEEALKLDPIDYRALANLAILKKDMFFAQPYRQGDRMLLGDAKRLLKGALNSEPDNAHIWNAKCVVLYALGELDQALEACRKAVSLDDTLYQAASNLGKVYALKGDFETALQIIKDGIERADKSDTGRYADGIWLALGTLQLHLGIEEAFDSITQAVAKEEQDARNHLMLARLHLTLPGHIDYQKALADAGKAASYWRSVDDPRFDRILALAYLRNDLWKDAITAAEVAIEGHDAAYGHVISAIAHARLGERDECENQLDLAEQNLPDKFGEFDVDVQGDKGYLWVDTLAEFEDLRREAEELIE